MELIWKKERKHSVRFIKFYWCTFWNYSFQMSLLKWQEVFVINLYRTFPHHVIQFAYFKNNPIIEQYLSFKIWQAD